MDDIAAMESALDATPTDWALRRVLHDAYLERGEELLARYQQWACEHRRHPSFWTPGGTWMWWSQDRKSVV